MIRTSAATCDYEPATRRYFLHPPTEGARDLDARPSCPMTTPSDGSGTGSGLHLAQLVAANLRCRVSCRAALARSPTQRPKRSSRTPRLMGGARGPHLGDGGGQAGLRLAQDARLRVVVALPGQLPRRAVAQPHKHRGQRLRRVLAAALCMARPPYKIKSRCELGLLT